MSDEQIEARLDALEAEIGAVKSQLGTQASAIQSLTGLATDLLELARLSERRASDDRALIREIQSEVRGLQAENRRILDYLFQQRNNGGSGSR